MNACPTCHAPQRYASRQWWICTDCGERLRRRMNPLLGVYLGLLGTVLYSVSDVIRRHALADLSSAVFTISAFVLIALLVARSDFMLRFMPIGRATTYPSARFLGEVVIASAVSFGVGMVLTWLLRFQGAL